MNIVFVSNYFNHHQRQLSDSLEKLSDKYCFISTKEMREERKQLGYGEIDIPNYVFSCKDLTLNNVLERIDCADVAIVGSASEALLLNRIHNKKLFFRYSERPLKKGFEIYKYPYRFLKWHRTNPSRSCSYLLCASAYTSADFSRFFLYKNRMYKWGYFPETKHYDLHSLLARKKQTKILWCGRFLDWKHPDDAIRIAHRLKSDGYDFALNIIGTGIMEETLRQMICKNRLEENVHLLGSMPPGKVREHMEQAGIYLFTSDRQEGWGAVLNESMNSGCAVVASHAIGAVPYLMKHNSNGLIYKSGNVDALYQNVKYLLDYPEVQRRLGEAAYHTITDEWDAGIAAERFVNLAQHILDGEQYPDLYSSGPCSKAEVIKDDWFDGESKSIN